MASHYGSMRIFLFGWTVSAWLYIAPAIAAHSSQNNLVAAQQALAAGNGRKAVQLLLPAAHSGDAEAAYWLGRLYYYDEAGVKRNWKMSAYWFAQAAQLGHAGGQYKLGGLYYTGRGLRRDIQLALRWWAKAAMQGHAEALNNLGALIGTGTGTAADPDLGLALQVIAAEKGSDAAQQNVRNKVPNDHVITLANELAADPLLLAEKISNKIAVK